MKHTSNQFPTCRPRCTAANGAHKANNAVTYAEKTQQAAATAPTSHAKPQRTCDANSFAIAASCTKLSPAVFRRAALYLHGQAYKLDLT